MTFSQSHGAAYTFLLFYSFKLKLAVVCRELNSVSSDRNGRTMCHFVRSTIFKKQNVAELLVHPVYINSNNKCCNKTSSINN